MAVATVESTTLEKIITFVNDNGYKELMQNSARYNIRMRKDRIYRQPYIDGQTGVAQRHCNLFVSDKHRMPGILQGQVYTYPARRWKAQHRSYLGSLMQDDKAAPDEHTLAAKVDPDEHTITTVENPAAIVAVEEEPVPVEKIVPGINFENGMQPEQWASFYDEPQFEDELEEDFESEEDFEDETYNRKGNKRKKPPIGKKPKNLRIGAPPRSSGDINTVSGGIPKKASKKKTTDNNTQRVPKKKPSSKTPSKPMKNTKKDEDDTTGKPYSCELCGMRYKTRPGLTYHYAHSHKEDDKEDMKKSSSRSNDQGSDSNSDFPPGTPSTPSTPNWGRSSGRRSGSANSGGGSGPPGMGSPGDHASEKGSKKKVSASPYCDFCLGDSSENKKTGIPENLVSCADCGRSGHPTCLQFTTNMMKSVVKYRWQCIECKTCTLCGTSENDDQLLFCDDCDRGYHLYCLDPPLLEPPEGEWSCCLCIQEFHTK